MNDSGNAGNSILKWIAGVAAAVVAAVAVAYLGIGRKPDVTIDGPTTARYGFPNFTLVGHVNGAYDEAYWTDTFGHQGRMGDSGRQDFYCPAIGQFTVTLTARKGDDKYQASHSINCYP